MAFIRQATYVFTYQPGCGLGANVNRSFVSGVLLTLGLGGGVFGAPVSEALPEARRPEVMPWSDNKVEPPFGAVLPDPPPPRASSDGGGASIPRSRDVAPPPPVEPAVAGPTVEPILTPGVRLESHSSVAAIDRNDEFPVEVVAIGMIVGGVLLAAAAWVTMRRSTDGR